MIQSSPIQLDFKSANGFPDKSLQTFTSYFFERNIMVPCSSFRFQASGVDKDERIFIRSGDLVELWVVNENQERLQIATGFVDETDTHGIANSIDYNITGRDTLSQLVDNDAIDESNKIIFVKSITLDKILSQLIQNTRLSGAPIGSNFVLTSELPGGQFPTGNLLLQTNVGESKINALSRYMEYTNTLIWTLPDGRPIIGKPRMFQKPSGSLISQYSNPTLNNLLEWRVKRNVNQAIRKIATQLQSLGITNPALITLQNQDADVQRIAKFGAGRSVYRVYSLGNGLDAVNTLTAVGPVGSGGNSAGQQYSLRQIAEGNMKVLDVEAVLEGHTNENGLLYNVDQTYQVVIEDEDVNETLFVYHVTYELTIDRGKITRLRLCRPGCIVADLAQFGKSGT